MGVFLEISPTLASDARVVYPHAVAWDDPNAVFLSGYTQQERIRLIDTLFSRFKNVFGYFPESVGAWWIDSYSLNYLENNYGISSALIVANQLTTDDYGVWGQWWGIPYYPSRANVLVPGDDQNQLDVVIIQWAQRDVTSAFGAGTSFSNYSLQANDYSERGRSTDYFISLTDKYLNCNLPIGQITVGLETGMESVKSFPEYKNQLEYLSKVDGLKSVTMRDFADIYKNINPNNPETITLTDDKSSWVLSTNGRKNEELKNEIFYKQNLAFSDYFLPDNSKFLNRSLPIVKSEHKPVLPYFYPLVGLIISSYLLGIYGNKKLAVFSAVLSLLFYFLYFKSYANYGWEVYYSFAFLGLPAGQLLLAIVSVVLLYALVGKISSGTDNPNRMFYSLLSTFILDLIIIFARYTQINEVKYFGLLVDPYRFVGVTDNLEIINRDFPGVVASSMLRFNPDWIWDKPAIAIILFPFIHLILGMVIYFAVNKLNPRYLTLFKIISVIIVIIYIVSLNQFSPRFIK
jgi:hypothetical protein